MTAPATGPMAGPMDEAPTSSTRLALAVALGSSLAFVVLAWVVVPWSWLPGGEVDPVPALEVFTSAEIDRGERVAGLLRHAAWGNLVLGLLVALVLGLTTVGGRLVGRLPGPWWLQVVLGCLAVSLIGAVVSLPLGWSAQRVRRTEGLSGQAWASWLTDRGLGLLVTWVLTSVALLVLVGLARRLPRTWPLWGALAAASLVMLGSFVHPVVVEPLFNDFRSLEQGPLRERILALAEREDVPVDDVLVADASRRTTRLNAYVSGFGSTRRVVVYDTLLSGLPASQIEVVVAHELGHARHRDVLAGTVLTALGTAAGVGLLGLLLSRRRLLDRAGADGAGDPRVVPLVLALATVGTLLASPVESTISRAVEARADRDSLAATGQEEAFIEMQRQLALRSLADPTPPEWSQFWFGSHPTVLQRIGLARAVEMSSGPTVVTGGAAR